MGKKHRQACQHTAQARQERAAASTAVTGAVSPKKRKEIAAKKAAVTPRRNSLPTRSPENERRRIVGNEATAAAPKEEPTERYCKKKLTALKKEDRYRGDDNSRRKGSHIVGGPQYRFDDGEAAEGASEWREAESLAERLTPLPPTGASSASGLPWRWSRSAAGPTSASRRCSTASPALADRSSATSRALRSDRIYGEVEWNGRTVPPGRHHGGVVPDDEAHHPRRNLPSGPRRPRRKLTPQ